MATYILYGSKVSLTKAKEILEELLTLQFEARESEYQGGEYFHAGCMIAESFELKRNVDPFDGDPVEMNFPEFPSFWLWLQQVIQDISEWATLDEDSKSQTPNEDLL